MSPNSPWKDSGMWPLADTVARRLVQPSLPENLMDTKFQLPVDISRGLADWRSECYSEAEVAPLAQHEVASQQSRDVHEPPEVQSPLPSRRIREKRSAEDAVIPDCNPDPQARKTFRLIRVSPELPACESSRDMARFSEWRQDYL